jgi:hypothetical protein
MTHPRPRCTGLTEKGKKGKERKGKKKRREKSE